MCKITKLFITEGLSKIEQTKKKNRKAIMFKDGKNVKELMWEKRHI